MGTRKLWESTAIMIPLDSARPNRASDASACVFANVDDEDIARTRSVYMTASHGPFDLCSHMTPAAARRLAAALVSAADQVEAFDDTPATSEQVPA